MVHLHIQKSNNDVPLLVLPAAAGRPRDAVGVCASELDDPQLALFLARLLEPSPGPLLRHTLADELLPREAPLPASFLTALHQDKQTCQGMRTCCNFPKVCFAWWTALFLHI